VRSISSGVDSALADMLKNSFVTKFSAKRSTDGTQSWDKIYKFTFSVSQVMGDKNVNGMHIPNYNIILNRIKRHSDILLTYIYMTYTY